MAEASYDYAFRVYVPGEDPKFYLSFVDLLSVMRKRFGEGLHFEGAMIPGYTTWVYPSRQEAESDSERKNALFKLKTLAGL
jgi:hypothetical protein